MVFYSVTSGDEKETETETGSMIEEDLEAETGLETGIEIVETGIETEIGTTEIEMAAGIGMVTMLQHQKIVKRSRRLSKKDILA